jgi:hypothetical protein
MAEQPLVCRVGLTTQWVSSHGAVPVKSCVPRRDGNQWTRFSRAAALLGVGELILSPLWQLWDWIRPTVPPPVTVLAHVSSGPSRLCTMGPAYAELYARVDPFTRTRFATGERFVLCGGGCGRAYKLVTCQQLAYRCPVDSASLSVLGDEATI